jgi:hypothetical protein
MVPVTLGSNVIVSPGAAAPTALRSEPAPLSFVFVTTEGTDRSSSNVTEGRKDGFGRRRNGGVRPVRGANIFQKRIMQTSRIKKQTVQNQAVPDLNAFGEKSLV